MLNQTLDYTGQPGFTLNTVIAVDGARNTVHAFIRTGVLQPVAPLTGQHKYIVRASGQTCGTQAGG